MKSECTVDESGVVYKVEIWCMYMYVRGIVYMYVFLWYLTSCVNSGLLHVPVVLSTLVSSCNHTTSLYCYQTLYLAH